ncbi:MAG: hypothetical protein HYY24_21595 [Verrucomicrobia bacterium]|nr:hypothetical protein [Verrucomicrobiota bacterium]
MGIHDRDYMKRRADDDGARTSSPDEKLDALLSSLLRKHSRKLKLFAIALVVLLLLAILVAKFAS